MLEVLLFVEKGIGKDGGVSVGCDDGVAVSKKDEI